ncbi:response regulator [Pelotalea chapellei]|nr:response regulator [Pelotalea chapellei]
MKKEQVRILCVDDDRNVLRALERIFFDDNYDIILANSGEEGLEIIDSSDPFQIIISDYRMPVMNGVEFLKKVYEHYPETVRIVLSGYADAGSIVAAINEGHIYKFIPKPWNDEDLRATIQNSLERYFLLKRNRELLAELAQANEELESRICQRTEQLELRNRAMEFSQSLLGYLPVAVIGVDETGMVAYCNDKGAVIMRRLYNDIFGVCLHECCDIELGRLVEQVRLENQVTLHCTLAGTSYRFWGQSFTYCGNQAVVIVLLEN